MSTIINISFLKIGFLLVLFVNFFSSCKEPEPPEFRKMTQVKFESVHVDKDVHVNMLANALLFNPNAYGLDVVKMEFDIFVDGKEVTHIEQPLSATMNANSESLVPIALDIPLVEVFKGFKPTIAQMLTSRKIKIKVEGIITAKAGLAVKVPLTYEDEYPVPLKMFINF